MCACAPCEPPPPPLVALSRLTQLSLVGCCFESDGGLRQLRLLPCLRELTLRDSRFTTGSLASVALPQLHRLSVAACDLVGGGAASLAPLAALTALTALDLALCDVTDANVQHLAPLTALQWLSLCGCALLSQRAAATVEAFTLLRHLDLR